jgi:thiazole/oxazole-forming peptide maturase SagC family component
MIKAGNLRIKRHYSIVAHSPDVVELRHGVWNPTSFTLTDDSKSGKLYRVVSRLDGALSPAEIAQSEDVSRGEVEALLDHLIQLDVIESASASVLDYYLDLVVPTLKTESSSTLPARSLLLLGDLDLVEETQRLLQSSLPDTEIICPDATDPAYRVLQDSDTSWLLDGIAFEEKVEQFLRWSEYLIVFTARVINPIQFRILNRVALRLRIPWIHSAIDGPFLFIGPTFVPHRTSCYECLETRITMNLRESGSYQRYKNALVEGEIRSSRLPIAAILQSMLAAHVSSEALNFALTGFTFTVNKMLAIYLPTMEFSFNEVLRLPGCPACGSSIERDDKELYFDFRTLLGGG